MSTSNSTPPSPASTTVCSPHTEVYQAAVHYSGWYWSVIPLYKKKPSILYRKGGKLYADWKTFQSMQARGELLDELFGGNSRPNEDTGERVRPRPQNIDGVGVICGPISGGLCVRDFDDLNAYMSWARAHPDWARRLPTVRTYRGAHVYFRMPRERAPVYKRFADGELIGDSKHYVVLPPSRHPKGITYAWVNEPASLDEFPVVSPEELGFLADDGPAPGPDPVIRQGGQPVALSAPASVDEAIRRCLPDGPGQRNHYLLKLARTLKAVPGWEDPDEDQLRQVVYRFLELAGDRVRTKDPRESVRSFLAAWPNAVASAERLKEACLAEPVPAFVEDKYGPDVDPAVKRLGAVCVALQRYHGASPFFLSGPTAEELCKFKNKRIAAAWLKQFTEDGLLHLAVKHGEGSRKAYEYRLLVKQQEENQETPTNNPDNPPLYGPLREKCRFRPFRGMLGVRRLLPVFLSLTRSTRA